MKTINETFEAGFKKLSKIASTQPAAQQALFKKLAPVMVDLAAYYDTLPSNNNYESYGYEFVSKKDLSINDQKVVVAFTSQAVKLGRE